jgi:hypothetical protein
LANRSVKIGIINVSSDNIRKIEPIYLILQSVIHDLCCFQFIKNVKTKDEQKRTARGEAVPSTLTHMTSPTHKPARPDKPRTTKKSTNA